MGGMKKGVESAPIEIVRTAAAAARCGRESREAVEDGDWAKAHKALSECLGWAAMTTKLAAQIGGGVKHIRAIDQAASAAYRRAEAKLEKAKEAFYRGDCDP